MQSWGAGVTQTGSPGVPAMQIFATVSVTSLQVARRDKTAKHGINRDGQDGQDLNATFNRDGQDVQDETQKTQSHTKLTKITWKA